MLTRRLVLAAFAAVLAFGINQSARAGGEAAATAHVELFAAKSLAALDRHDLSASERRAILAATIYQGLDIPLIAAAVLGKAGSQAGPETRKSFEELFGAYLTASVARKLAGQADGSMTLLGCITMDNGDFLVDSRLVSAAGKQIRAVWRVRDRGQGPKVVDIAVEGISLVLTQRQEFGAVIQRQGLEGLLTLLQGKVQTAATQ